MTYNDLAHHFSNILASFYSDLSEFINLIDLMNESRRNRTPEILFLNLTTALEVFHKHFATEGNNDKKKQFKALLHETDIPKD